MPMTNFKSAFAFFAFLTIQQGLQKKGRSAHLPCCLVTWLALELLASSALSSNQVLPILLNSSLPEQDISTLEKIGHFYFVLTG